MQVRTFLTIFLRKEFQRALTPNTKALIICTGTKLSSQFSNVKDTTQFEA